MNSIAEIAARLLEDHQQFVLATIISRQGSTPRMAGTRMIITGDGQIFGTIGGGLLEARVVQKAGEVLSSRRPVLMPFDMQPSELATMDMICGGRLEVLVECVDPGSNAATVIRGWGEVQAKPDTCYFLTTVRFSGEKIKEIAHCLLKNQRVLYGDLPPDSTVIETYLRGHADTAGLGTITLDNDLILVEPVLAAATVFLFGGGHVAQPTARLAAFVGFRVRVVDDRSEYANPARFPDAEDTRVVTDFDAALAGLDIDRRAFIVIVTRGHLHDKTVLMQALRTEAAYIGMIGSRRKRDHIFSALLKQGFTAADMKRVHSPIGLDIRAETPEEIALSIVAEMVQVRAQGRV
jgi:xanthine dehydrogenase accessory factor